MVALAPAKVRGAGAWQCASGYYETHRGYHQWTELCTAHRKNETGTKGNFQLHAPCQPVTVINLAFGVDVGHRVVGGRERQTTGDEQQIVERTARGKMQ